MKDTSCENINLDRFLNDRKNIFYKTYRSQQLSGYYGTLIQTEKIYIPPKFRPKVNISTGDYEKNIQREYAVQESY